MKYCVILLVTLTFLYLNNCASFPAEVSPTIQNSVILNSPPDTVYGAAIKAFTGWSCFKITARNTTNRTLSLIQENGSCYDNTSYISVIVQSYNGKSRLLVGTERSFVGYAKGIDWTDPIISEIVMVLESGN